ncbi:DNA cytosine methyltransferase [Bacillus subtilis]|uniref:DNA cytosine methyltransferase n=1 Tax=Bacillus subtilis TaxID=1423 RepID=UPI0029C5D170|nr:DNA cytosine methyltransferase [Bacillus subtilis]MDX6156580.1 DNA cytosine methyltransferase [Bacillus subtilis]MEC0293268.1 DNA cytosine methyltransferase [Bacillus subtilis]MEC0335420.1 DNA cytosine methyltransferase [Bacillus subtilis]MEC0375168.1 DNA cytosine methyltransferase [Bacillus subtilis]
MKIEKRGRAKYSPMRDYDVNEVKALLLNKINEEQEAAQKLNISNESQEPLLYNNEKLNLTSLFSGCGGLDLGFELAGLDVIKGAEKTSSILKKRDLFFKHREESVFHTVYSIDMFKEANQTYRMNFPQSVFQSENDIRKVKFFPKSDIVIGGFPCPGFSEAGPRLIDDERNFLYIHFIRCLIQSQPFFFVAENVKGMLTLGKGEVIKQIIQDFESAGYKVKFKLTNARDYGVPQYRERVFIVGVREDIDYDYEFPVETHGVEKGKLPYVTLKDAIGDLEENPGEWYDGSFSSIYMSRNRKKTWNDQSFTIQASGRQAPLHPGGSPMIKLGTDRWEFSEGGSSNRRLSVKEIARIQTFPDWFTFSEGDISKGISKNGRLNKVYKQIGNAVPVELARAIARPIAEWSLKNKNKLMKKRNTNQQLKLFDQ